MMKDQFIDLDEARAKFGDISTTPLIETSHGVWHPLFHPEHEGAVYALVGYRFEPHVLKRARAN